MDAQKAYSNLLARIKLLEDQTTQAKAPFHLAFGSEKSRTKHEQNMKALEAKFDDIVREAEVKLLEASVENVRS